MDPAVRPAPLRAGERIAIVAPGSQPDPDRLRRGIEALRTRGFDVGVAEHVWHDRSDFSPTHARRRAAEIDDCVADERVRVVWAARGGYGSTQVLDALDHELWRRRVPWLVGFSDLTALSCGLMSLGIASLAAPMIEHLDGQPSVDEVLAVLGGGQPAPLRGSAAVVGGFARGLLAGGNLTVAASLCGTRWTPRWGGCVVVLEDLRERPHRLDRALRQLAGSGALDGVAGFALGRFTDCDDPRPDRVPPIPTGLQTVRSIVEEFGVPALEGIDVGHDGPHHPLVWGQPVELDADAGTLTPTS